MSLSVILGSFFTVVFVLVLAVLVRFGREHHPAVKRMQELQGRAAGSGKKTRGEELGRTKERLTAGAAKMLREIGFRIMPNEEKTSKLRKLLVQAGYRREDSVKLFAGIRTFSAVVFFILFAYIGQYGNRPWAVVVFLSFVVAAAGYFIPNTVLNFKIQKRQEQIAKSLADAIDLLVIGVEAGLGLNAALLRVGSDLAVRNRAIAEEFCLVNQDLRTGIPREKALRNLGDRNRLEDLRIFTGALILADRLGTSVADTLRAQADSLRTRIRQKAEEQAARAGIKMLFPLVFFILPALIIILMGPAVISVVRTFNP